MMSQVYLHLITNLATGNHAKTFEANASELLVNLNMSNIQILDNGSQTLVYRDIVHFQRVKAYAQDSFKFQLSILF